MYVLIPITQQQKRTRDQDDHMWVVLVFKFYNVEFHVNQQGVGLSHKAHSEGEGGEVEDCRDSPNCI